MEDFVNTIKNNIETERDIDQTERHSVSLKKLICKILSCDSEIKITEECNENGDIHFDIYTKSLNLSLNEVFKHQKELDTRFMANFLGEIFVREHVDKFVRILMKIKDDYLIKVNKFQHQRFGMCIYKDRFSFIFHASLIQSILTEDFKKNLK